jgi:hypothetical protein
MTADGHATKRRHIQNRRRQHRAGVPASAEDVPARRPRDLPLHYRAAQIWRMGELSRGALKNFELARSRPDEGRGSGFEFGKARPAEVQPAALRPRMAAGAYEQRQPGVSDTSGHAGLAYARI